MLARVVAQPHAQLGDLGAVFHQHGAGLDVVHLGAGEFDLALALEAQGYLRGLLEREAQQQRVGRQGQQIGGQIA